MNRSKELKDLGKFYENVVAERVLNEGEVVPHRQREDAGQEDLVQQCSEPDEAYCKERNTHRLAEVVVLFGLHGCSPLPLPQTLRIGQTRGLMLTLLR